MVSAVFHSPLDADPRTRACTKRYDKCSYQRFTHKR